MSCPSRHAAGQLKLFLLTALRTDILDIDFGMHHHHIFDQEKLEMAKEFTKLTRRARRMAKSETKIHSGKPAKMQKIAVLPPQTNIDAAQLHSADSQSRRSCPPAPNHTNAQLVTFSSNEPTYASAGRQETVLSSIAPFPFSPPSAFASWNPYPISHSEYVWSAPLRTTPPLPIAFLLGAIWASKAPVLYASTPPHF